MKKNKNAFYITAIAILVGLCALCYFTYRIAPEHAHDIHAYYNRNIEANEQVITIIQNADKYVYFAIYTFTRTDIAYALLGAKHRGLDVRGITDKDQLSGNDNQKKIISELREAGIPLSTQDHAGLMHIKAVVTDKAYASGSYNWTAAATDANDEILEIGYDENVRKQYENILREVLKKYQTSDQ